jgi:hypothetical protein
MSRDATETKIATDGLRYKTKVSGSPFTGSSGMINTMSCFKCGLHKSRALGSFRRLMDKSHFFCGDCRPVKTPA